MCPRCAARAAVITRVGGGRRPSLHALACRHPPSPGPPLHTLPAALAPQEATEDLVRAHFSRWGTVTDVYFPRHKKTLKRRPFCFVTFASTEVRAPSCPARRRGARAACARRRGGGIPGVPGGAAAWRIVGAEPRRRRPGLRSHPPAVRPPAGRRARAGGEPAQHLRHPHQEPDHGGGPRRVLPHQARQHARRADPGAWGAGAAAARQRGGKEREGRVARAGGRCLLGRNKKGQARRECCQRPAHASNAPPRRPSPQALQSIGSTANGPLGPDQLNNLAALLAMEGVTPEAVMALLPQVRASGPRAVPGRLSCTLPPRARPLRLLAAPLSP